MKSNWLVLGWQHYISAARLGLWAPSSSLVGPQTASRQNQPAAPGEPSILLRLLFSSSQTSILPGRRVKPPPSLARPFVKHPPTPLFLRSTGLVKVSQSPVALLYRLQRFFFKWRLLSCEYPRKEWLAVPHLPRLPPFVWLFWSFTAHLSLDACII